MTAATPTRSEASRLRRVIVGVIILSFGIAALGGIVVLLGGDLGDPAWKVLATTASVGVFSIAVLCCTALVGRRVQLFGLIGAAISILTLVLLLIQIWREFSFDAEWLWKALFTGVAATVAFSLASLLLLLVDRRRGSVRWGLWITLGLFAAVLLMVWYAIWWSDTIAGDAYPRTLGVLAILAALGAVVVPVMSLLLPDQRPAAAPSADTEPTQPPTGGISIELADRLRVEASRRGITVDELVAPVLEPPASPTP